MENLYTVQKTYEALAGPIKEGDQNSIFDNEYARKMYYAGLTKTSVQSAIHWLEKPENKWVADWQKMLDLLKKKFTDIAHVQAEARAELRANPFVINAMIPKGETAQKTAPIPAKSSETPIPTPEKTDFSQEQKAAEKILKSLEKTDAKNGILVSEDGEKAWKWDRLNPDIAKMKWNTHTTLWWEKTNGKRTISVFNDRSGKIEAVFTLDDKNRITDKKISDTALDIRMIPFIPNINIQIERSK